MPDTNLLLLFVGVVVGGGIGFFALGSRAFRIRSEAVQVEHGASTANR